MNVVRCIEHLFDRAVSIEKIVCQIEDSHFRVTLNLQWIEGIVGLFDVFVEGFSGCMARQDLRQDDVRFRELVSDVGDAHLYPISGSFDARLRREEHVVVADHHDHQARFEAFDAAGTSGHIVGRCLFDSRPGRRSCSDLSMTYAFSSGVSGQPVFCGSAVA